MKLFILFGCFMSAFIIKLTNAQTAKKNLMCYYEGKSYYREGLAKLTVNDLEPALHLCTHLIYGYADIGVPTGHLVSSLEKLDLDYGNSLWRTVTGLKRKFPHLKILLSVGGDKCTVLPEKYMIVVEEKDTHDEFANSAKLILQKYKFDGLDLAWQFPKKIPKELLDNAEKATEFKNQFTALVRELKNTFQASGHILGLSVLPHVNASLFFNAGDIIDHLDYINLHTYDFYTPERNPNIADFSAPIYPLKNRNPEYNIQYQVQYWLNQQVPASKINVCITSFGRAWMTTRNSGLTGLPPVAAAIGFGPSGLYSRKPGLLSYIEICSMFSKRVHPWRRVGDTTKRYGTYAFSASDVGSDNGVWVSYEDADSAANKADFVKQKGLGGVALVDLSNDDFTGSCTEEIFPILHAIKHSL